MVAAAAPSREKIDDDTVRKATNALLKWKQKKLQSQSQSQSQSHHDDEEVEVEETDDDFMYLSITLKKAPPRQLTAAPYRIPLRRPLLSQDYSTLNICLIVDGKRTTAESAHKILVAQGIPYIKQVFKLPKLKSDYTSFESKKKLYDSFDLFLADKRVVDMLPKVLGRVFYKKRKKIPVAVDLGGDWKEEIEKACTSSWLCFGGGTCSAVRVGRLGVLEAEEIVENVFDAVDAVVGIAPRKWNGIRGLHLKLCDSLALPIYEQESKVEAEVIQSFVGVKRKWRRRTD